MAGSSDSGSGSPSSSMGSDRARSDNTTESPLPQTKSSSSNSKSGLTGDEMILTDHEVSLSDYAMNYADADQDEDLPNAPSMPSSPAKSTASSRRSKSLDLEVSDCENCSHEHNTDIDDDEEDDGEAAYLQVQQELLEAMLPKVRQLCLDLGLGEPSKVEHVKVGGYNRIVALTLPLGEKNEYIVRIPRRVFGEDQAHEIKDQVATLLHLAKCDAFETPTVVAWDTTTNNAIGSQYVIQTRLPGDTLHDAFYSLPLAEKLEVATSVAEMLLKLESVTFEKPGRLVGTDVVPNIFNGLSIFETPVRIAGYRDNPMQDGPLIEKQPIASFLLALLEHRKQSNSDWKEWVASCERLQAIVLEMQDAGMMRNSDNDSVLWHWDLSASNIMIHSTDGILGSKEEPADQMVLQTSCCSGHVKKNKNASTEGCAHKLDFEFDGGSEQNANHTININLEGAPNMQCHHKVDGTIEDHSGATYRHTVQISGASSQKITPAEQQSHVPDSGPKESSVLDTTREHTGRKWIISGVLDWDDALAVPLVLSRKPPSWLWLNDDERPPFLTSDRDVKPWRDLDGDELLVKAHFDQVMARADPSYLEDAYGRGRWLRALARFAVYNFEDGDDMDRLDRFIENWGAYHALLAKGTQ